MAKKGKRRAAPPPPAFVPEWRQAKQVGPTPQPPRKAAGAVSPDWWRNWMAPAIQGLFQAPAIQGLFRGSQPPRQVPSYVGMTNPYAGTTRQGPSAGNLYPYQRPAATTTPSPMYLGMYNPTPPAATQPTNYTPLTPGATTGGVPGMDLPFSQYGVSYGPGGVPITGGQGMPPQTPQSLTYLTPVEQALADVGQLAAGQPQVQPQEGPYAGAFPGYWEAMGQQPGNYPVPQGAIAGMPDWRGQWEEWSWSTRGIPLQGNEIFSISRGGSPWGGPWGSSWGGGGGGREEPPPEQWNPPASQQTF